MFVSCFSHVVNCMVRRTQIVNRSDNMLVSDNILEYNSGEFVGIRDDVSEEFIVGVVDMTDSNILG